MKKVIVSLCVLSLIFSNIFLNPEAVTPVYENILKDASISANSEYYNGWYEYNRPLSSLIDGKTYIGEGYNAGNMFATEYSSDGLAFLNFKFASPKYLNTLLLYFAGSSVAPDNPITDYAVDVKLVDGSWKRIAEKHSDGYTNWDTYTETLFFEKVLANEIQITMKNEKAQSFAAIYEVEAFLDNEINREDYTKNTSNDCTNKAIPLPERSNVLYGIIPTIGVIDDWYSQNRPLKCLTDGKNFYGTGYNLAETTAVPFTEDGTAYFNFSFDNSKEINHINMSFPGTSAVEIENQLRDFAIFVKLQNGNWQKIAQKHLEQYSNWDALLVDIFFEKVVANEVRIIFTNSKGQDYAALYEVEAYYDNTVTKDKHTNVEISNDIEFKVPYQIESKDDVPIIGVYGGKDTLSYGETNLVFDGGKDAFITLGDLFLKEFRLDVSVDRLVYDLNIDIFETATVGAATNRITLSNGEVYFKNDKLGHYEDEVSDISVTVKDSQITISLKDNNGNDIFIKSLYYNDCKKGNIFLSASSNMTIKNISVLEVDKNGNEYKPNILKIGDCNCDFNVNAEDITELIIRILNEQLWIYDDVNKDGQINIVDLVKLKNEIAGISNNKVFVANYGSDKANGTATQPFATLSHALDTINDNGVIEIIGVNTLSSTFKWNEHNKNVTITGDTLDFTKINDTQIVLGDSVTFDNVTLCFNDNDYLYANGHSLCVEENVVLNGVIRLYGGGVKDSIINGDTNIKVLSGTYEGIYGGSNNGTINGNTNVYVGGNVNETININHVEKYFVYGGGVGGAVTGDTNVIFTDNAKAEVVVGGYNCWSDGEIGGNTNVLISGGKMMGVYGGNYFGYKWEHFVNNKSTKINSANITVTGGEIQQVFGGNANAFLTGDVNINILGGKITRRIYGGCYNNLSLGYTSSCYVKGNILLKISSGANISLDYYDDDRGIFAISRYKNKYSDEVSKIIFDDELAYEKYFSKIGPSASDRYMKQNLPSRYYDEIVKNY